MAFNDCTVIQKEGDPQMPPDPPYRKNFGILKQKVYDNNWKAENLAHLEGRIKRCIKKIQEDQPEIFQKLFSNLKSKIDYARIHGLQNVHNKSKF